VDSPAVLVPHVVISLFGLVSGFVLIRDFLRSRFRSAVVWTFLVSTTLTSATGYLFPRDHALPSHVVGGISLLVLVPTWLAWRPNRLFGMWKRTFVIGATVAQWLNVFVLVAQLFQKAPALRRFAPTGTEPPFGIAEGAMLLVFVAIAIAAWQRNRASSIRFD